MVTPLGGCLRLTPRTSERIAFVRSLPIPFYALPVGYDPNPGRSLFGKITILTVGWEIISITTTTLFMRFPVKLFARFGGRSRLEFGRC